MKIELELELPDSLVLSSRVLSEFRAFLQAMCNRRIVGALRYGAKPNRRQKYMTRLSKELRAYRSEGNFEQLLNIAVYAYLESAAPENSKLHWNAYADSITRADMGGNIE